jgi:hypothetical protein
MIPEGAPGPHSLDLPPPRGHSVRVRLPERLPSAAERSAGGAQGIEDLVAVAEVPAVKVSSGGEGLHHPGRAERALDARDPSVGEVEQDHARPLGDERVVDEPGGVPRGSPPDGRDGGSDYRRWWEVEEAFKRAAALMNRENQASGKEFRSTRHRVSKHRRPLWTRH